MMISKHLLFSGIARRCFSVVPMSETHQTKYVLRLSQEIPKDARLILPISMDKYDDAHAKIKKYDKKLNTLFEYAADLLQKKHVSSVDVLSTAELYQLKWRPDFEKKIADHFFEQHAKTLREPIRKYTWNQWMAEEGKDRQAKFDKYLELVNNLSQPNTEWYKHMMKTYEQHKKETDLESVLKYQRQEFAGMLIKQEYSHIIYMGKLPDALSYMYHIFPRPKYMLPVCVQASCTHDNHPENNTDHLVKEELRVVNERLDKLSRMNETLDELLDMCKMFQSRNRSIA
jgi:hypothetical protein